MSVRFIFGEWVELGENISLNEMESICEKGKLAAERLSSVTDALRDRVLTTLAQNWSNPDYKFRKEACEKLPQATGFSIEMINLGMDALSEMLRPEHLNKKVKTELRGIPISIGSHYDFDTKSHKRWHPLGTILHVLSGNVFLVGPGSFIEGLLTKNATLLKLSSEEKWFMPFFMKSVVETEGELGLSSLISSSVACIDYRSGHTDIINLLKSKVNGVLVWGGEAAISAYRDGLPASTKFIPFGPKLSFGIVTSAGVVEKGLMSAAQNVCQELAIWDQKACTAPQVIYVESEELANKLIESLVLAAEEKKIELPNGEADNNTMAEIRKLRNLFDVKEALGEGYWKGDNEDQSFTFLLDYNLELEPSPLYRTVKIVPYQSMVQIAEQVSDLNGFVQTIGLWSTSSEMLAIGQSLANHGALKIVELGSMSGGEIDDPHDGAYDLPHLLNLVVTRVGREDVRDGLDHYGEREKELILDNLFCSLVDKARQSEFYGERLKKIDVKGIRDISQLPVIGKGDLADGMDPRSFSMNTSAHIYGGAVTRTGGSTGKAKFSWFPNDDWREMTQAAVRAYHLVGLSKDDRVANTFTAGNLYGSFISFYDVNQALGMTTFPFAGGLEEESFFETWKNYNFNVVQGIPSCLIPFLKKLKSAYPEFSIEKIIYAGEPLNEFSENWLREELKVKDIISVIGTTEAGLLGIRRNAGKYKLLDDYNYIEIIDDLGNPVKAGEAGKIIVTNLKKMDFPVIRYDIGDRGAIFENEGKRELKFLGRGDSIICFAHTNIEMNDFSKELKKFNTDSFQFEVEENIDFEKLIIRVEGDRLQKEVVESHLKSRFGSLFKNAENSKYPIEVLIYGEGEIPREQRTGKLKKIIDQRNEL